jgi:hypothetical protein
MPIHTGGDRASDGDCQWLVAGSCGDAATPSSGRPGSRRWAVASRAELL